MTVFTGLVALFLGSLAVALSPVTAAELRGPSLVFAIVCGLAVAVMLALDLRRSDAGVGLPRRRRTR